MNLNTLAPYRPDRPFDPNTALVALKATEGLRAEYFLLLQNGVHAEADVCAEEHRRITGLDPDVAHQTMMSMGI